MSYNLISHAENTYVSQWPYAKQFKPLLEPIVKEFTGVADEYPEFQDRLASALRPSIDPSVMKSAYTVSIDKVLRRSTYRDVDNRITDFEKHPYYSQIRDQLFEDLGLNVPISKATFKNDPEKEYPDPLISEA